MVGSRLWRKWCGGSPCLLGDHQMRRDYESDHYHEDENHEGEQEHEQEEEQQYVFTTSPSENEKYSSVLSLYDMRNDAAFCDVAFLVHGCLFRAHKVIVSSWSRWMYALLSEGSEQEIISLDLFTPTEFGAVLDYMYGQPLEFNIENAESMFKVIRRLEMKPLEQKCWKYLLSIIDANNCERLHQLADFFDCTPLKLTAWRVIQENKPGYSTAPAEILQALATGPKGTNQETVKGPPKRFIGHGLIGPGERIYGANYEDQQSSGRYPPANMQDESDDEEEGTVSIFNTTISGDPAGEGLLSSGQKRYDYYVRPDQLPKGTPAKEVVRAWAFRLQQVYQECCEEQGISPDQMNQLQRNQRSPQQSQSSPVLQSAPQSTSLTRNSVSLQQVQRRQNPPAVNRMPSLDRISDISDPPQQEQISQRSTPQRQTSRPTLTPQLSTGTVGSQSRTGGIAVSRGSVAAQGRGMYPDTIEEKETDTVSTEEKDESYTAPISKQPFQTPTLATRPSIRPTPTALPPPSAPPNTVATTLTIDWKEELRKFYISRGLMDKLDSLDTILNAWEGKEKEMIEALYGKYQMKIPSELQQKLIKWEELYGGGDSETQSER